MKHILTFFLSICLLISFNANSQMIKGKVLNESGRAAAKITVKFTNKANSITTNADGTFKIMANKLPDTLIFSADGFESYKVVVTEKTVADPDFAVVLLSKRDKNGRASHDFDSDGTPLTADASMLSMASRGMSEGGVVRSSSFTGTSSVKSISGDATTSSYGKIKKTSTGASKDRSYYSEDSVSIEKENYATKLLTAGEVNDFSKWKMWEDYSENDFSNYSNAWKLYTNRRYCVQIQTKDRYAAVGKTVYLIDANTLDTVWMAVTDNTGKAELWGKMFLMADYKTQYIITCNESDIKISKPYLFHEGINRITLNTNCNVSNVVDIAFVVDATGSMGDEIEYLKLELEDVLTKTFNKYNNLELRAGAVFYRDNGDEYVTKYNNFNTDLLKTLNFIKLQKAAGGGDMPEAVDAALETAIDSLEWSKDARAKIMFLILDAPPHDEAQSKMYRLIQKAAAKGIRIVPIACSGTDKNTEFLMRTMALATNGTYVFLTDDSGVGGKHIKPTTDSYNVELLNDLLPRVIEQMIYVNSCSTQQQPEPIVKTKTSTQKVTATPNPTTGQFTIATNKPLKEIFIADFTGKILMRLSVNNKQTSWNVNIGNFPAGTYIVKYVTTENQWGAEKVVLVH